MLLTLLYVDCDLRMLKENKTMCLIGDESFLDFEGVY